MKNVLIALLVVLMAAGAVGGTWYYMDIQLKDAQQQITLAQGETSVAKAQVSTLEADLKAKADLETAEQLLLSNLDALLMMGSGSDVNSLETYYDSSVLVEGSLTGASLRSYSLALQKYWKTPGMNQAATAVPVKFTSGEWSVAVTVKEKSVTPPLVLNQSGSVVRAPARVEQEIMLTLIKWKEGKIIEQYDFPYVGDVTKSNLLKYITPETPVTETTSTQGALPEETAATPADDIIPAQSSQSGSSAPETPAQSSTGMLSPDEA